MARGTLTPMDTVAATGLAQDTLDAIVMRLVAQFHPVRLILFGSHATGPPRLIAMWTSSS